MNTPDPDKPFSALPTDALFEFISRHPEDLIAEAADRFAVLGYAAKGLAAHDHSVTPVDLNALATVAHDFEAVLRRVLAKLEAAQEAARHAAR